jgi:hypothetical protein
MAAAAEARREPSHPFVDSRGGDRAISNDQPRPHCRAVVEVRQRAHSDATLLRETHRVRDVHELAGYNVGCEVQPCDGRDQATVADEL